MKSDEKKLKKAIIKSTNSIKKKYHDLHKQRLAHDEDFRMQFMPIIDPLNKLIESKEQLVESKEQIQNVDYTDPNNEIFLDEETPQNTQKHFVPKKLIFENSFEDTEENIADCSNKRADENCVGKNSNGSKIPTLNNLSDFINIIDTNIHDSKYGVRRYRDNFMIGHDIVEFNAGKIYIKNNEFNLTNGLKNLLFLKNPSIDSFTKTDLNKYKSILLLTNAHKKHFESNAKLVRHSKSHKFMKIIQPLFKSGKGVQSDYMIVNDSNKSIEYTYWDDPNELIERLRLLLSSKSAGHNAHNNEIISIIEELKEADIIF